MGVFDNRDGEGQEVSTAVIFIPAPAPASGPGPDPDPGPDPTLGMSDEEISSVAVVKGSVGGVVWGGGEENGTWMERGKGTSTKPVLTLLL